MDDRLNIDELKKYLSDYEQGDSKFTIDDIIASNSKKAETEKAEQESNSEIETDVVKPDGISITGAFEAIRMQKSEAKAFNDIENTSRVALNESDVSDNDDNSEPEQENEHLSVEITSEINNQRFFDTEMFNSIKSKSSGEVKNSLASFAKGEEEQDDGEREISFTAELTEEIDDFETPEEKEDILLDLKKMNSSASFKFGITFVFALASGLFYAAVGLGISIPAIDLTVSSKLFVSLSLALSVAATLININSVFKGFISLFKFKCTPETMLSLAFVSNAALNICYLVNDVTFSGKYISFDFIYILLLTFNIFSKKIMAKNILKNFLIAASDGQKTVVDRPQIEEIANDIMLETGNGGDILYASKSKFVSEFIHNSFKDFDLCSKSSGFNMFLTVAVLAFAVMIFVFSQSGAHAIAYAAGAFCVVTPILYTFSLAAPIFINSRKARKFGGAIVGSESAYALEDAQTLIVDDSDVFNIALNGIRLYGESSIDDAIIFLCSLFNTVGGPLKKLFMDMLGDNVSSLPRADEIYYHDTMGYSCLVHSKVFVVGNKKLMNHFGIDVDDSEFEIIYQQKQKNALFVAYDGKLTGVFLLSYSFAHGVSNAFSLFESDQMNVAIAERDANITSELLNNCYKATDKSLFKVMNFRTARNCFGKFELKNKTPSILLSNTGLKGIAYAFHGCRSMLFAIKSSNVIKIISSIMALILITFLLFFSEPSGSLPTHILIYQVLWSLPILFVSLFSK